jgi:hypothetical protein
VGASAWRQEKEGRGGAGIAIGSVGRPAAALGHRARVASLWPNMGGQQGTCDVARRN